MAEEKLPVITYAEDVPQQDFRPIPWQIRVDGCESGMQCFYSAHWCYPRKEEPGKADAPKPSKVGHPPHLHKENEIMMLIGGDPDDPYDLGATVEFCIGKDMKKYTFTRSVTVMIPGGTPHGYYKIVDCRRPFMFVQIQEAPVRTEKFLWEYLTQEQIDSIEHKDHWKDTGFDD